MMGPIPSILAEILEKKKQRVSLARERLPIDALKEEASRRPLPRDFLGSLLQSGPVAVIAEIKRRSPSKGLLAPDLKPGDLARSYQDGGAAAISVITEEDFFCGSPQDLLQARRQTSLPILRKDFIFDPYQIYESRAMEADAILLIARCLEEGVLGALLDLTHALGMSALVEVHSKEEAQMALRADASIIGINNRDLSSFETDLATTQTLAPLLSGDRLIVSESGIKTAADVARVRKAGARAVLVGETLIRASRKPGAAIERALRALVDPQESGS